MSTAFSGTGNIAADPISRTVPNGNEAPRHVLNLYVYFDRQIRTPDGYRDRGGYFMPVVDVLALLHVDE